MTWRRIDLTPFGLRRVLQGPVLLEWEGRWYRKPSPIEEAVPVDLATLPERPSLADQAWAKGEGMQLMMFSMGAE